MTNQPLSSTEQAGAGSAGATMAGIAQDRYGPAPEHVLRMDRLRSPRSPTATSSCGCTPPASTAARGT